MKPLCFNKTHFNNNITFLEKDHIVTDSTASAEIINIYFCNSVEILEIDRELYANNAAKLDHPIDSIIEKFKDHPSILNINQKAFTPNTFSFQSVSEDDVGKAIKTLDSSKAYQVNNIPPKLLKDNADICLIAIHNDINRNIVKGCFPVNLKNADTTPTFKKDERLLKINYRPVNILATLSKVYE